MRRHPLFGMFVTIAVAVILFVLTIAVQNKPNLGLDLQGGVSVVLKPSAVGNAKVTAEALEQTKAIIMKRVDAIGVGEPEITVQGQNVVVQLPGIKDQQRALDLVGKTAELRFRPVLQEVGADLTADQRKEIEKTRDELRAKLKVPDGVSALQVYDAEQTARGLPTYEAQQQQAEAARQAQAAAQAAQNGDPSAAGGLSTAVATTAAPGGASTAAPTQAPAAGSRSFRVPRQTLPPPTNPIPSTSAAPTTTMAPTTTTTIDPAAKNSYGVTVYGDSHGRRDADFDKLLSAEFQLAQAKTATTPEAEDVADKEVTLATKATKGADGKAIPAEILKLGPTMLTGQALENAQAGIDKGAWLIRPTFKAGADGIDKFNAIAGPCNRGDAICPTKRLAIVLDGVVLSAPNIQNPSFSRDSIQISGSFSEADAKDVALALRYGSLPLVMEPQQVQTVSATLGQGALHAGLIAGAVGLAAVALFILAYYRILGLVTVGALFLSAMSLWTIIGFFGRTQGLTLTLSGLVGIVVSIGMSLDSSVVYFENLKEDVLHGRSLRSAVGSSFDHAYTTIVKADLSSLIGAVVLYVLSVGPVKGFAFYLGLSTVLDLSFSYLFTRPMVGWLGRSKLADRPRLFGIPVGSRSVVPTEGSAS
jgi:preprotein translocase subunit SecD